MKLCNCEKCALEIIATSLCIEWEKQWKNKMPWICSSREEEEKNSKLNDICYVEMSHHNRMVCSPKLNERISHAKSAMCLK